MPRKNDGTEMPRITATVIALSAAPYCRAADTTPAAMPNHRAEDEGRARQDQRRRKPLQHLVEDRPVQREGAAEIALDEIAEPDEILAAPAACRGRDRG